MSDGPQRLTIVATDAAGNTQTVTRDVTLDLSAPLVAFASPASGTLTNAMTIDVSGMASDATLTSVVVNGTTAMLGPVTGSSRPFAATIRSPRARITSSRPRPMRSPAPRKAK